MYVKGIDILAEASGRILLSTRDVYLICQKISAGFKIVRGYFNICYIHARILVLTKESRDTITQLTIRLNVK